MSDETPKIIVDTGWKDRVQREREEAAKKAAEAEKAKAEADRLKAEAAPTAAAAIPGLGGAAGAESPMPGEEEPLEANFITLVASLATQAMFALGMIAQPGQREVYINLDQAHFTLDTLDMLKEKTKGNLTPEEDAHLTQVSAELEQVFQARVMQFQQQAVRDAGIDPKNLRNP